MKERINGFRKLLIAGIVLICIVPISASALSTYMNNTSDNENKSTEITVSIEDTTNLSEEKIEKIKNDVLEYHINGNNFENLSTHGITCTLFGHDKQTNRTRVVEHKVAKTEPRCKESIYNVTTCSRCDYEEISCIGYSYIYCCPED